MNTFYALAVHAHSGWRWVVLVLLLMAVVRTNVGWKTGQSFTEKDRKLVLFTMIAFHLQVLGGIILYFISPKVAFVDGMMSIQLLRFFTVEHMLMMFVAMALITIGNAKVKKGVDDKSKFKSAAIFYTIGLIVVLASIPWPFREGLLAAWF